MTTPHESVVVLSRALDQAGDVLAGVQRRPALRTHAVRRTGTSSS